jgi:hypothetical protein
LLFFGIGGKKMDNAKVTNDSSPSEIVEKQNQEAAATRRRVLPEMADNCERVSPVPPLPQSQSVSPLFPGRDVKMSWAISPIHTIDTFQGPLTLDQKIEIFIARVKGWQIQPALDMRERDIPHRGFAQLAIVTSYFEMIAKYREGYLGEWDSSHYFKRGMLYTFPELPADERDLLDAFYKRVRNGLYHLGITSLNVTLFDGIPGSFGFHQEMGELVISPDKFAEDIAIRFDSFANELRDHNNIELRRNFEARFDHDNDLDLETEKGAG